LASSYPINLYPEQHSLVLSTSLAHSPWQNVTLTKCRGTDAAVKTTKRERKMISLVRKSFFPYFWKDFYFSLEIKKIPSYFRLLLTPRAITLKIFTAVINFTVSAGNFHPSLIFVGRARSGVSLLEHE